MSVDDEIKQEYRQRKETRRQIDVLKGLSMAKGAQRGDFDKTRRFDKILADYKRFKNPGDREKIKKEYFQAQKEARRG